MDGNEMTRSMKYRKGFKIQLAEDVVFSTNIYPSVNVRTKFINLDTDGTLLVMAGYASDGCSGTRRNYILGSCRILLIKR